MSTPVCVCAFQRLPCSGAPPRSWAQATYAAASPHRLKNKNKTSRPAPFSQACPLHDDVWRCSVSLFSLSPFFFCSHLFGPGPIILPARLAHDLWTQGYGALLASTCRGNDLLLHFLFVGQSAVNHLGCSTLHFFFPDEGVQPFGLVSPLLLLLTASIPFLYISAPSETETCC